MKANRDDAPKHITRNRKSPIGRTGITVIVLVAGILFMADRNGWIDYVKARFTDQPLVEVQTTPVDPVSVRNTPSAEDLFWQKVEAEKQRTPAPSEPAVRQTSFNDSNYQPKRMVNTMPPPPRQYAQAQNRSNSSRQQQGLNGRRNVTLRWEDNRQKRFWWSGTYRWSDNQIMTDDLCARSSNYPKGSIGYRACRKAAKEYLRNQCRSQSDQRYRTMYCHADSGFRH